MSRVLHPFPGGLLPDEHKAESSERPIVAVPLVDRYVVPLRQHLGNPAKPVVREGDYVLRGQLIGAPDGRISAAVHAPTSGRVRAVADRPVAHPSGLWDLCVEIEADGRDAAGDMAPIPWRDLPPGELPQRLRDMGLAGLGGAVFPSHVKLDLPPGAIHTLIVNGAECEPWITCDDRLMRERAADILRGVEVMAHILGAREILVGIEDNKPEAAIALGDAAAELGLAAEVAQVPTRYPSGGAKQLAQMLTGREVPSGKLSTDIGIQVFNVGTAYALWRAVSLGEPLLSRVVTITGHVPEPGNFEARIGTPLVELLRLAGGELPGTTGHIVGGPLMGFDLEDSASPVVKGTNCIIAASPDLFPPRPAAMPCIRCGECALACPARLQPFELYNHARVKDFDKAERYNLRDCIECGCCSYVCPSHIPLVDYYRFAKSQLQLREQDKALAEQARRRHEFHTFRLEREKQEKAEKLKKAATKPAAPAAAEDDPEAARKKAILEAAMERARQAREGVRPKNTEQLTPEQQRQVDEAEARRARLAAPAEAAPDAGKETAA